MPDIFKQRGLVQPEGSVSIPDVTFPEEHLPDEEDLLNDSETPNEGDGEFHEFSPEVPEPEEPPQEEDHPQQPEEPAVVQEAFTPAVMTPMELEEYYRAELDEIKQDAAERAYSDAIHRKKGELIACMEQVDAQLAQMHKLQEQFMEMYAKELKFMAVDIAEKMILAKIGEDDTILNHLLMQTVSSVKNASWLTVEVSERLVHLVDVLKQELSKEEYHGRARVEPIAAPEDTCRVSTEDGTVVSTISVQAQNLRDAFRVAENK